MPRFPKVGKPDENWLEELFKPTLPADAAKRAERIIRSQKARGRRAEIKALKNQRALKDRGK